MLKKFREFTYRYVILSSLLITILYVLLMNGTDIFFYYLPDSPITQYAQEIVGMLYSVGIVLLLGFKDTFRFKGFFKGLICASLVIVFMLFSLIMFFVNKASEPDTVWASRGMIILGIVQFIGIGIREECFFRGSIQNILAKKYANSVKGVWLAAFIGSLFFAFVHSLNIFAGYNPLIVLIQVLSAIGSGLFFAAIYLRSGNIWVSALVHALVDSVALAGSAFLMQSHVEIVNKLPWQSLIGTVVFVVPAVFLLRSSKCKEIVARFDTQCEEKSLEQTDSDFSNN